MSQTAYANMSSATAGLLDSAIKDAISLVNAESSAAIPFGRMVQFASGGAKILTGATNIPAGIVVFENDYDRIRALSSSSDGPAAKAMMAVLRRGRVWVKVEGATAIGDRPFVRHTANGGNTDIGVFSNASGTGLMDVRNIGQFVTSTSGAGLALLDLNMNQMAASAGGSAFKSTEQTGNGGAQNVAHGLGVTPSLVIVYPTDTAPATTGAYTMTEGTHDATNCVVTVTTGKKYKVVAFP